MKTQDHFFSKFPFGYAQNFVIITGIVLVGVLIEGVFRGSGFTIPSFPYNWMALCVQILLSILIAFLPQTKKAKDWMSSVPFVVVTSVFLILFVLLSGFISQPNTEDYNMARYLGLSHIVRSWYFVFVFFLVSLSLQLVIIKRWSLKTLKDFAFFLNHLGMLILILASFWGSSDLRRVLLDLRPDELVWTGVDQKQRPIDFPFAIKLKEFHLDEYQPQIVFIDSATQKIHPFKTLHHAEKKLSFKERDWQITVLDYQAYIWPLNGQIVASKQWGSPAGAEIEAIHLPSKTTVRGWISTSTMAQAPQFLTLSSDEHLSLALIDGRPKRFSSDFSWFTPDGQKGEGKVEVNKPFSIGGWKLYQYGYDEAAGRWSQTTVLEAIRDPWLPIVYLGMILALLGTLLFIWTGKDHES